MSTKVKNSTYSRIKQSVFDTKVQRIRFTLSRNGKVIDDTIITRPHLNATLKNITRMVSQNRQKFCNDLSMLMCILFEHIRNGGNQYEFFLTHMDNGCELELQVKLVTHAEGEAFNRKVNSDEV